MNSSLHKVTPMRGKSNTRKTREKQTWHTLRALLAACLAVILCLPMLPGVAFGEEPEPLPEEQVRAEQLDTQATQVNTAGWIKNYGGDDSDFFNSVAATSDGDYVAVGESYSSNGFLPGNKGWFDAVIAKFDANGNMLWVKNYGGRGGDRFDSVIAASDGGYVAVGGSDSSDGDLLGNKGGTDFIIAKFDANGNKLWFRSYGGSENDSLSSVVATADGGYVAVGTSGSSDGDLPGNKGGLDFIIAKFDANGNKVWIENYGGSKDDRFNSVTATHDGGYVAVGESFSANGDLPGNRGYSDAIIAKFDANGNKVLIGSYGGSGYDYLKSVVSTPGGGYVAVGDSASANGDLLGNKGYSDFIIAKFDANGNKVWIRSYGGSGAEHFSSVVATIDGCYTSVGDSESLDGDLAGNRGNSDFIIAKFDSSGNKLWIRNCGGASLDSFTGVVEATGGGYVAAGTSFSSDDELLHNERYSNAIIAKFDANGELNLPLTRKAGATRHGTAALASQAAYPNGASTAIIANASNYPDALAASTLAGMVKAPILLSPKDKLDTDTQAELIRLKPTTVYIVGSTGAISTNVANQLKTLSSVKTVKRLGGANRFATAKLIAEEAIGLGAVKTEIYLVSGDNFPDALSVASFSVIKHIPVLLTSHSTTSKEVADFIKQQGVKKVTIIGGTSAVSKATENALVKLLDRANVIRLAGSDRYDTAQKVTTTLISQYGLTPELIGVATGDMFADALSGGASLGARGGVLVLCPVKTVHPKTKDHLQVHLANKPSIEILGGTTAISAAVEREIRGMFGY